MVSKIQQIFELGWKEYASSFQPSPVQKKAALSLMHCKSGALGCNLSICQECGHTQIHYNSCRSRCCPNCQALLKELWVDERKAEVIDAPYFHVVFTLPAELNPLIYSNQKPLYDLLHKCCAETLLDLAADRKFLGATPGIIQVLHTWGQNMNFHPHIHCIISGGGLTRDKKLVISSPDFFIPVRVLGAKFRGKFLAFLEKLHAAGKLSFPASCSRLQNPYAWKELRDALYSKDWCPFIKETFNGFGNAIDYLGRYTHRIAISNARILSVSETEVSFSAKDYKTGDKISVTVSPQEFIRRFLMHVPPQGFRRIRYYGFLNSRSKKKNLQLIFRLQGHRQFLPLLKGKPVAEVIRLVWGRDISICPCCGKPAMQHAGRCFPQLC